ncbi:MAG TPA: ATPase domain-containing protein, partial [Chloroflexota bacterium]
AVEGDSGLASVAHTVIDLEYLTQEFGGHRRRLRVQKMRASQFRGGYHDFNLLTGGLAVYPRLVASEHEDELVRGVLSSGVSELDELLGGGLDKGTSVLVSGPAGTGKSALSTLFVIAAAERGERSALYLFDERVATFLARAGSLKINVRPHIEAGRIAITQLDPAQVSPGEFIEDARREVEEKGTRLIVIDSLNGYLNAMAEERAVLVQLHEFLTYLGSRGVLTLMTIAQSGLVGPSLESPLDASYLADTVIVLRYFESAGSVRKAIAVMKKRTGRHENSLREFRMGPGIQVGQPLREFQGVLSGVPAFLGGKELLLDRAEG